MHHVYCISGFGADHRVFKNLDFGNHEIHFLPWFTPEAKDTLTSYASKMADRIKHENPVLVGLSMGGMVSVEIGKLINVNKTILISTIKTKNEKPFYFKLAATLKLNKLLPATPYPWLEKFENYNLGINSEIDRELVKEYRKNLDPVFSKWALEEILNWQNDKSPENYLHIHGSNDHIFPIKYVTPTHTISGGGHMMIMNKAREINCIIKQFL